MLLPGREELDYLRGTDWSGERHTDGSSFSRILTIQQFTAPGRTVPVIIYRWVIYPLHMYYHHMSVYKSVLYFTYTTDKYVVHIDL